MRTVPDIAMRFTRHLRYEDLPKSGFTGKEHEDEARVREFDEVFDRVAAALGDLYLVDSDGGCGVQRAPILMDRHVDVCRQHTIVVHRQAWHPDVVKILHAQLQGLPEGWILAIDATDFPPGQAHIVVEANGTVHGWSDYSARSTLNAFGFDPLNGLFQHLCFAGVSFFDALKGKFASWYAPRKPSNTGHDNRPCV